MRAKASRIRKKSDKLFDRAAVDKNETVCGVHGRWSTVVDKDAAEGIHFSTDFVPLQSVCPIFAKTCRSFTRLDIG